MRHFRLAIISVLAGLTATGCARHEPIQTDRTVFNFDSSYQRATFAQPIETTFDRTVKVFRDSGYVLDIVDRATGQISGRRGKTADKGGRNEVKLQFFALVMPSANQGSQLALKFTQVARVGIPIVSEARTEILLSQPELYAYIFRRVDATADRAVSALPPTPVAPATASDPNATMNADVMPTDPATPQR